MIYYTDHPSPENKTTTIDRLPHTLTTSSQTHADLAKSLNAILHQSGWWPNSKAIAKTVLDALQKRLEAGSNTFGPALSQAQVKVLDEAKKMQEFAGEHPVLTGVFCTVVALGVLWLLWPEVLGWLGFGEMGPVEGELLLRLLFAG